MPGGVASHVEDILGRQRSPLVSQPAAADRNFEIVSYTLGFGICLEFVIWCLGFHVSGIKLKIRTAEVHGSALTPSKIRVKEKTFSLEASIERRLL